MTSRIDKRCGTCVNFKPRPGSDCGRCLKSPESPADWEWHKFQGEQCPLYSAAAEHREKLVDESWNLIGTNDALLGG